MVKLLYYKIILLSKKIVDNSTPYLRRMLRFIALPYCYFCLVNWEECKVSRIQVAKDMLYIFFMLKYYPDNYSPCRLWEKERKDWKYYYGSIYDPYQRAKLRREVHPKDLIVLFENKYICYKMCVAENFPLPKQFGCYTEDEKIKEKLIEMFRHNSEIELIIKPWYGSGGSGILLSFMKHGKIYIKSEDDVCSIEQCIFEGTHVIQEYIPSLTLSNFYSNLKNKKPAIRKNQSF